MKLQHEYPIIQLQYLMKHEEPQDVLDLVSAAPDPFRTSRCAAYLLAYYPDETELIDAALAAFESCYEAISYDTHKELKQRIFLWLKEYTDWIHPRLYRPVREAWLKRLNTIAYKTHSFPYKLPWTRRELFTAFVKWAPWNADPQSYGFPTTVISGSAIERVYGYDTLMHLASEWINRGRFCTKIDYENMICLRFLVPEVMDYFQYWDDTLECFMLDLEKLQWFIGASNRLRRFPGRYTLLPEEWVKRLLRSVEEEYLRSSEKSVRLFRAREVLQDQLRVLTGRDGTLHWWCSVFD